MDDKAFLDTNIPIYAYSEDEPKKQSIALQLLDRFEDNIMISKQVINELINILLKKFKLSSDQVENVLLEIDNVLLIVDFDLTTQIKALKLKDRYRFQYYDALIVATALENNCTVVYSEDMQHDMLIDGSLKIINPFNVTNS
ncbi:PIN domain-containing protein [Sulfuricurvum sp.]|uniref:PIN domain-containing protein n=1 Tax=Sulfuricurvum sp. TaxID=2025608 RepID=UPI0019C6FEDC|nr:PIN domain-containing protein [Sulfuricurvum sp.]MBD3798692.1 PIN domain-containing protein [Campylobacterota bacterium]MBD3805897.1 PIN domain-containing protein [Sulfuricurvum sp.]